jgi:hypothetical protein
LPALHGTGLQYLPKKILIRVQMKDRASAQ